MQPRSSGSARALHFMKYHTQYLHKRTNTNVDMQLLANCCIMFSVCFNTQVVCPTYQLRQRSSSQKPSHRVLAELFSVLPHTKQTLLLPSLSLFIHFPFKPKWPLFFARDLTILDKIAHDADNTGRQHLVDNSSVSTIHNTVYLRSLFRSLSTERRKRWLRPACSATCWKIGEVSSATMIKLYDVRKLPSHTVESQVPTINHQNGA